VGRLKKILVGAVAGITVAGTSLALLDKLSFSRYKPL